jgi:hypothetical protein
MGTSQRQRMPAGTSERKRMPVGAMILLGSSDRVEVLSSAVGARGATWNARLVDWSHVDRIDTRF